MNELNACLRNQLGVVLSASVALPRRELLGDHVHDARRAEERGYFLPDEDERVREVYARYLAVRSALLGVVDELQPVIVAGDDLEWRERLQVFVVGFAAACMLVRSAGYMVDLAQGREVVWKKLDEAESRYGIPRRTFSDVYRSLSSPRKMWRFHESVRFYEAHRDEVLAMEKEGGELSEVVALLRSEEEFLQARKRDYVKRRLQYGLHAFVRGNLSGYKKVMFHLFRLTGSAIAELKQPHMAFLKAGKRVTPRVLKKVESLLEPGDVIVTRHDEAMSNLFLPGFWPHAAFYVGSKEQRRALGVEEGGEEFSVVEAKKDGVKLRMLAETLSVDAFVVIRPKVAMEGRAAAVRTAISHAGKRYDFLFDFSQADRLACTEVVYRSYQVAGGVDFELAERAGRLCLSAEDLLDQALGAGAFDVVALYGVEGLKVHTGQEARRRLWHSYSAQWGDS